MRLRQIFLMKAVVLAAGLALLPGGARSDEAAPASGQIDIQQVGDGFSVTGLVTGHAQTDVQAELTIAKRDAAGQVSSTQGRALTLEPGVTQTLAQSTLSLDPGGQIEAVLTLSRDGVTFERVTGAVRDGRIETQ